MKKHQLLYVSVLLCLTTAMSMAQPFSSYPLKGKITHTQPFTGIVFWADNTEALDALGNKVQLEFAYMLPADVVSDSGDYDWSKVESILNQAKVRGHQCILRFRYTYPGITKASVPSYLLKRVDYTSRIAKVEGLDTFLPDWSNAELKRFTLEFFTKFAARYDRDPRLAYLQVGFGSYAEYHLFDGPFELGNTFPDKAFQEAFLNHIHSRMVITPWSISIDAADGGVSPFEAKPILKNLSFGLFDDSFMHKEHSLNDSEYNRASWLFFGTERWKKSPAGGEFSYYTEYDQEHALDLPNGPYGRSFESFAAQYHLSYILGSDQYQYQSPERIGQASRALGYHFVIKSYKSNGETTEVEIQNTGIAPIYYEVYPTLGSTRSTTSLKGLIGTEIRKCIIDKGIMPGETLTLTSDKLLPGQYIEYDADLSLTVTQTEDETFDRTIQMYPQPVKDILYLSTSCHWQLHHLQGYKIMNGYGNTIPVGTLSSGVYMLHMGSTWSK
ncbi:MAG TPA: hypothetical protein VL947_02050, partial [Cytophagales bacterium]|nr:hypothetical protein [Cytophagales bacterium]